MLRERLELLDFLAAALLVEPPERLDVAFLAGAFFAAVFFAGAFLAVLDELDRLAAVFFAALVLDEPLDFFAVPREELDEAFFVPWLLVLALLEDFLAGLLLAVFFAVPPAPEERRRLGFGFSS